MKMLRPLALLILGLLPAVAFSQVYSWKDANGKVHYGSQPPSGQNVETRKLAAPPPVDVEANRKALAERQMNDREQQKKSEEEAKKNQESQAEAQERAENCQLAKANLAAITSGQVRFKISASGERIALEGAVRDAELAKANKSVSDWCTPPKPAK